MTTQGSDDLLAGIFRIHGIIGGEGMNNAESILLDQLIFIVTKILQEPIPPLMNGSSRHIKTLFLPKKLISCFGAAKIHLAREQ